MSTYLYVGDYLTMYFTQLLTRVGIDMENSLHNVPSLHGTAEKVIIRSGRKTGLALHLYTGYYKLFTKQCIAILKQKEPIQSRK